MNGHYKQLGIENETFNIFKRGTYNGQNGTFRIVRGLTFWMIKMYADRIDLGSTPVVIDLYRAEPLSAESKNDGLVPFSTWKCFEDGLGPAPYVAKLTKTLYRD